MTDGRLYHAVASKITDMIETGAFPPGSRLPGERELAEQFGVSRVTIREAEIALQALGRLQIKTGSGVYVQTDTRGSALPDASAFELTQARLLFESEAAALAAPVIDDATLDHLERLIRTMTETTGAESDDADREFHLTVAEASKNSVVRYVVEAMWKIRNDVPEIKEVYDSVCEKNLASRRDEHGDILEALRNRDSAAARAAMRNHFARILEVMLEITEEQALNEVRKKSVETRERFLKSI
ncbi:MAG: FadR/GntR family transcriptional regulator [Pseudomonadota bacterium]